MEKKGIIYKATCVCTGKSYIGKSFRLLNCRIQKHIFECNRTQEEKYIYNTKFYNAIRKYGIENFKWEILYKEIPENMLDIAEMCAIYVSNSYNNGYNLTLGGDGFSGEFTKEHRYKISKALKKYYKNNKKIISQETRQKFSLRMQGHIPWNKGKKLSEEHKRKVSEQTKKAMNTPKIRNKFLKSHWKGSILTEKEVKEIKNLINLNEKTQQEIADLFHVHRTTISNIKCDKIWKHVS